MSHILEIIFDAALSLIGIVFVGWLFWRALKRSDDPAKILFKCLFSAALVTGEFFFVHGLIRHLGGGMSPNFGVALIMTGSIAACGIILSIVWTPQISEFLFKPLTSLFDGGDEPPEPKPFYSIALAKRKRGEFLAAAIEVRKQLDHFPNDYEGVMLLAAIQAEDMKDLSAAENTLNIFCETENSPPLQICAALTQLADWHLKLTQNADTAKIFLERIIALYPNSVQSAQAAERIGHLGGTEKVFLAAQHRQPTVVREGIQSAGLRDSIKELVPEEMDPKKLAADYVKHLEQHPLDAETREKLAIIYAGHYQRLDLAAIELEQLVEMPNQLPKRAAHWLNLLADLQIRHGAPYETVRGTLEKIIEKFPDLPVAELARSRLNHLKLEIKGRADSPENKKLGDYEQNVGLKSDRFYSPRQL